ncbi:MAG: ribonuclease III [Pseudomonadota bacterium]
MGYDGMPPAGPNQGNKRFAVLEEKLGHKFKTYENLERALTHSSARKRNDALFHYERLEFLGDRVLGLCVADMLHHNFPKATEGELSVRFNALVKGDTLAQIADRFDLHKFIRTGDDLKTITGKRMIGVRADVLEAVIASIYLDSGLEAARDFITNHWTRLLNEPQAARRDSKTELQEWAHSHQKGTPKYKLIKKSGPDHEPVFVVSVRVSGLEITTGRGRSKRLAEQQAARDLLVREGIWKEENECNSDSEGKKS